MLLVSLVIRVSCTITSTGGPIMSALLKASRNDAIIARCLQTISQLIPLSSAVFYRVNNRLKPEHYILHNISANTHQQYLENFQPLDPLLPSRFSHQAPPWRR
jgi:hypothetical protein